MVGSRLGEAGFAAEWEEEGRYVVCQAAAAEAVGGSVLAGLAPGGGDGCAVGALDDVDCAHDGWIWVWLGEVLGPFLVG